jgi:hypothetical protein
VTRDELPRWTACKTCRNLGETPETRCKGASERVAACDKYRGMDEKDDG